MPLKVGEMLRQRYRIEETLGQGGMGAVYRATDINLGVQVAVKENLFTTPEYARQFRREATILASLRHAGLPRVTDHFVIEGEGQYLVMDFIEGDDLREHLERDGPIEEDKAVGWFLDICDGLAYLHSRTPPIVHRDIKPGNIRITPDDKAILVDFGLAKVLEETSVTTTGAKAMTPGFSPPEQYGAGRTDPRTDIYALAATLYTALTAAIPEDSLERTMGRAMLTPIRRRNPKVSALIAKAIERALALDPDERFQTMGEFASALAASGSATRPAVMRDYPYLERTIVPGSRTIVGQPAIPLTQPKSVRSRWPIYGLLGVTVLAIAAGAVFALPGLGKAGGGSPATQSAAAGTSTESGSPGGSGPGEGTSAPTGAGSPTSTPLAAAPTSVAAAPSPTPPGGGVGQLAFASSRDGIPQIFVMNIDGTGARKVTQLADGACQPAWSPDGSQLAFTSPCRNNKSSYPGSSVWIIQADGSGQRALASAPGGDFDPAWSPLGDKIAFTSLQDGRPQIYTMNVDGTGRTNVSSNRANDSEPSWSPNGSQIIFTSIRDQAHEVWIMTADGGSPLRYSRSSDRDDSRPNWSPDGQYLSFDQVVGGVSRLVVMQFKDGGAPETRVCPDGPLSVQPMGEPSWSPDGLWLAFETWPTGIDHEIAVVTLSCANYAELTSHTGLNFDAAWRP